jgi:hypothetical protein
MAAANPDQLVVPSVDGLIIDTFHAKFSGVVHLDPTIPGDLAMINELRLGRRVRLQVVAEIDAGSPKLDRDKGGAIKTVAESRTLAARGIDSLSVLQEPARGGGPQTLDEAIPPAEPARPSGRRRTRADRGETPSRGEQARVGATLTPLPGGAE